LRLPAISGHLGVDVFFVISGFVMFYISADQFTRPGASWRFLQSRIVRIVPLYWLYTSLWLVAAIFLSGELNRPTIDPVHLAASYLFWPYPRPDGGDLFPVFAGGWSLNYEMFFYVIFASLLVVSRRAGLFALAAIFVGLAVFHPLLPSGTALEFWSRFIILEFLAGVAIAVIFVRIGIVDFPKRRIVAAVATIMMLALVIPMSDPPLEYGGVGSLALILVWATAFVAITDFLVEDKQPGIVMRALAALGDSSYSLYLSHAFTLGIAGIVVKHLHLLDHVPPEVIWAGMVAACVAGGFVSYYGLERPMLKAMRAGLPSLKLHRRKVYSPSTGV
jgi:exopolysaccharide production protein ExoZ